MLLFPCPNQPTYFLSFSHCPSFSNTHTHTSVHTTVCCAGKPNDQAVKPQVPKKKSQSLRCLALTLTSCVRKPFSARTPFAPHPLPPPKSHHYVVAPAFPTRFSSSLFSAVCKGEKKRQKQSWAPHQKSRGSPSWRVMSRTNRVHTQ